MERLRLFRMAPFRSSLAAEVGCLRISDKLTYSHCLEEQDRFAAAHELYGRIKAIARGRMSGQRAGHTLDTTSLANEAMVRLLRCNPASIRDEEHFLAVAAEAMRQILVDHARGRATAKRGGREHASRAIPAENAPAWREAPAEEILAAHEALAVLDAADPDAAQLVKLSLFAGIPTPEIAALMNVSRRTVERRLRFAIATMRSNARFDHPPKS